MEDTAGMLDPRRTHHHTSVSPKQATSFLGCGWIVTLPTQDGAEDWRVEAGGWNGEDLTQLIPGTSAGYGLTPHIRSRGDEIKLKAHTPAGKHAAGSSKRPTPGSTATARS